MCIHLTANCSINRNIPQFGSIAVEVDDTMTFSKYDSQYIEFRWFGEIISKPIKTKCGITTYLSAIINAKQVEIPVTAECPSGYYIKLEHNPQLSIEYGGLTANRKILLIPIKFYPYHITAVGDEAVFVKLFTLISPKILKRPPNQINNGRKADNREADYIYAHLYHNIAAEIGTKIASDTFSKRLGVGD